MESRYTSRLFFLFFRNVIDICYIRYRDESPGYDKSQLFGRTTRIYCYYPSASKSNHADRADHYPHQLSGGQQQRVAIARALALHPDILCFDEPTSALDPELTGEVLRVIRSLAEQKTTMIIVTHEMAFARDVADQVIFMDGGVIVEQGDPREVIDHPKEERTRQFLSRYANG